MLSSKINVIPNDSRLDYFSPSYLLLSRVMRNIRWIMWLTLSCSHSSWRDRKERLISATESSLSSTLSDTEFSESDWLSPESSTVIVKQETMWLNLRQMFVWLIVMFIRRWCLSNTEMMYVSNFIWLTVFCRRADRSSYMVVRQTAVVVSGLMQTVWHQPVSWRGQRRGCRRCSGCCCPGQSSHWGSTLTPSKIPA